jgi:hypothetical protein
MCVYGMNNDQCRHYDRDIRAEIDAATPSRI